MKKPQSLSRPGFTLVELLIVIVVIAILAVISVVAYNGVQERARQSKIKADLRTLTTAIEAARRSQGEVALRYITGNTATAANCVSASSTIDISNRTAAPTCWSSYDAAMNAISNASGVNVRGLVDPWGRPYLVDENEQDGNGACGSNKDKIGSFPMPRTQNSWAADNTVLIPFITPGC